MKESDRPGWNIFLALILMLIVIGAFLITRHLRDNIEDVGEATFNTMNKDDQ